MTIDDIIKRWGEGPIYISLQETAKPVLAYNKGEVPPKWIKRGTWHVDDIVPSSMMKTPIPGKEKHDVLLNINLTNGDCVNIFSSWIHVGEIKELLTEAEYNSSSASLKRQKPKAKSTVRCQLTALNNRNEARIAKRCIDTVSNTDFFKQKDSR